MAIIVLKRRGVVGGMLALRFARLPLVTLQIARTVSFGGAAERANVFCNVRVTPLSFGSPKCD